MAAIVSYLELQLLKGLKAADTVSQSIKKGFYPLRSISIAQYLYRYFLYASGPPGVMSFIASPIKI